MVIVVATKIVIGKADRDGRVAVRQGNGCDNDFTAAMAIPCFTGDCHKVAIGELSSVAICGTVLFSEESVIVEPLVLTYDNNSMPSTTTRDNVTCKTSETHTGSHLAG